MAASPSPNDDSDLAARTDVCACDEGEVCRVCLGDLSGLLLAALGDDGALELETMYEREQRYCACGEGEICRWCVSEELQSRLCRVIGRPWRDDPKLHHLLPSMWLAAMAPRN